MPRLQILRSITAGARPSGKQYGEPYVNFTDNQFGVFDSGNQPRDLIGVSFFSTGLSYIVGAVVNYQGLLYMANVAVSAGPWNPAQWTALLSLLGGSATTGDVKWTMKTVADAGWLMWKDGTIGGVSSGSNLRANADTQALFTLYYDGYTDTNCPLLTSTGAATTRAAQGTASVAFAANCRMTIPKSECRVIGISGSGSGITSKERGSITGVELYSMTLGQLKYHDHAPVAKGSGAVSASGWAAGTDSGIEFTNPGTSGPQGGSDPLSTMQPSTFINAMIKL